MTASFLITWERLPARPAALAICADSIFPVWQPVRVSPFDNQRTTRKSEIRLPRFIRTLSERSPSSQGRTGNWAGTVKRTVTPDRFRTGRPCRTPKPFAAINNLGRCLNGGSFSSSRIKPRKQSRGCFFLRLHRLLCAVDHLTNSAGLTGLVAHCDGHTVSEKEKACPTRDGSKMTQNGAIVS